jgi:hypothetical protein
MFILREEFTARPGQASKLAAMFKETFALAPEFKTRVMTDAVASFNTVVLETEIADLAAFENMMREYGTRSDIREKMKGYTDLYITGRREIYKVL